MPKTNSGGDTNAGAPFQVPADLTNLTVDTIGELIAAGDAELDAIYDQDGGPLADNLTRAKEILDGLKKLEGRRGELQQEKADLDAEFQRMRDERAGLRPQTEPEGEPDGDSGGDAAEKNPAVIEGELVGATPGVGGAVTASRESGGLAGPKHSLNPSLSGARQTAPAAIPPIPELAITASVGLPGKFEAGQRISSMRDLGELFEKRARSMAPIHGDSKRARRRHDDPYGGVQVASVAHQFEDVLGDDSKTDAVDAYIQKLAGKRNASRFAAEVAGGGWCAPPEPRYNFFNIAAQCGMIDLPTFGVTRGGIQFPVSPSLADTFTNPALAWYTAFSNATVPWLWTNTDDVATVTGAPNKPCIRVPCASTTTVQLECYGICLTAGNLADNAWPEATRNFLQLLMSAHFHASNARYISQIVSAATTEITGCPAAGAGAAAPILTVAELGAWDYRNRFGMCGDDVLEWILPEWSLGLVRADLAKRTGVSDFMCVPDSEIDRWFSCRNIRAQFVQDYQVRAALQPGASTPITNYPTIVNGLLYAAGTVARGNGMTLDLGVVRDSTLNAENDFTAAWMEECHLIAKFGHEIRNYRINVCPDGTTGAADLTACC